MQTDVSRSNMDSERTDAASSPSLSSLNLTNGQQHYKPPQHVVTQNASTYRLEESSDWKFNDTQEAASVDAQLDNKKRSQRFSEDVAASPNMKDEEVGKSNECHQDDDGEGSFVRNPMRAGIVLGFLVSFLAYIFLAKNVAKSRSDAWKTEYKRGVNYGVIMFFVFYLFVGISIIGALRNG